MQQLQLQLRPGGHHHAQQSGCHDRHRDPDRCRYRQRGGGEPQQQQPQRPAQFHQGDLAGPVNVTVKPFTLPGGGGNNGNAAATATFVTPAGNITLHHSANQVPGTSNPNSPPPATWTKSGTTCYFVATFSKGTGTFLSGTGKFSGAHGTFTYLVTAQGYAPLASGKTTCSFPDVGNVQNNGAQIKFLVTGPLTVKA